MYPKEAFGRIPNLIISEIGKVIDKFNIEAAKIQDIRYIMFETPKFSVLYLSPFSFSFKIWLESPTKRGKKPIKM